MEVTLECQTRPDGSKPNALRRAGLIPAVLYGHNGVESVSLTVQKKTAERLLRQASLNNTLITLSVPELPWTGKALLRNVHKHPWKGFLYHLSFFSIGSQESLEADVSVHLIGEAPGVKFGGGSLDQVLSQLHIRCAPELIPEVINVDVSEMQVGDALHVDQLTLPEGVVAVGEGDRVVVSVLQGVAEASE